MFSLTVVDHVRLDSEQVAQNYTVHARAAERLVSVVFGCRIAIVTLLGVTSGAALAALLAPARGVLIAAVVSSLASLIAFAIYMAFGLEARLFAHRAFAHRLWLVAQRYRSLLAEVHEGVVDPDTLLRRRDDLIADVHAIYEFGFGADQGGRESVRLSAASDARAA
jgi:hypothetical protein